MPPFSKLIKPASKEALWKGPQDNGPLGGISQSMIGRFLVCPERFRIEYILGLKPTDDFSHRLEYGQMWHTCEEYYAKDEDWTGALSKYLTTLCGRYPIRQEEILHWGCVCQVQFREYIAYWKAHADQQKQVPLLQETVFHVPYKLPSGRIVWLKGKWDSVHRVGNGVWLKENKTKGDIDELHLQQQLTFDLQTMFYLVALTSWDGGGTAPHEMLPFFTGKWPLAGILYNVVRRPLSGGRGSIRKGKPTKAKPEGESDNEFYARLAEVLRTETLDDGSSYFFMRWKIGITLQDIERFKKQFLDPRLEQLCDWYEDVAPKGTIAEDPFSSMRHWRMPWGVWNPLNEGRPTDVDSYLETGSSVGLVRQEALFRELQ